MSCQSTPAGCLRGKRIALVGKLAGMSRREAAQLVRRQGGRVVSRLDGSTHLIVVGEDALFSPHSAVLDSVLDEAARRSLQEGTLEVISETQLWQRLNLAEAGEDLQRLCTPAMLANLLDVPIAVIRRWHRRGLIVPVREVRRLPYFDVHQVRTAQRLAELLAAGVSPAAIEKKLAALARYLPEAQRSLAQLSVIVQGREILLRQGEGLLDAGGQFRFDFTAPPAAGKQPEPATPMADAALPPAAAPPRPLSPEQMTRLAAELEEDGQLAAAAETYRAAMAAAGPQPTTCFQLAELLYRQGDLAGARERYYMAVELDEDFVEARANLGCLLAETGQTDLAVAAFEGALRFHPQYADVHYHLARALDELGQRSRAEEHWRIFLELAPASPWAEEARGRLETA